MRTLTFERPLVHAIVKDWERDDFARYWTEYGLPHQEIVRLDWSSKHAFVRAVAKAYDLRVFVETGSHEGDQVAAMLGDPCACDTVHSVECDTVKYAKNVSRFRDDGRVCLWSGDSVLALEWIAESLNGPTLFWLDAHANGPQDPDPRHFPLKSELAFLFEKGAAPEGSVVLIDDARYFGVGHWPTKEVVMSYGSASLLEHDIVRIEV